MEKNLTVADFFCGAGGFSEGFRQAGFNIIFALDNWSPAQETHKLNHPTAKHPGLDCHREMKGNILSIPAEKIDEVIDDVDVIIGSPPCISFSSSNKAGKADKTKGIALIEKYLQIIAVKKHKKNTRLKYWLMENVPNSRKYIKKRYTFEMLGLNKSILKKFDIGKHPKDVALEIDTSEDNIYNSVHFEVPQKRKRFVCGEFPLPIKSTPDEDDWISLGYVLECLKMNHKWVRDPNNGFSIPNPELTDHYYDTTIPEFEWENAMIKKQHARYYGKMSFPENPVKPSRTVMATRSVLSRESMILPNGSPGDYRALTIRETASLMSFPITYQFQGTNEATKYRLVGNAVCPKLAFSFAKAILEKENMKIRYDSNPKSDIDKLQVDLRKNPPPKKESRDKDEYANFAEIVPDLKYNNFRVELDNNMPKSNDLKLKWNSSLHHATGIKCMKKAAPRKRTILKLLNSYKESEKVDAFIVSVGIYFEGKVPNAADFQRQHTQAHPDKKYITPRKSLLKVKSMVDKFFPQKKYQNVGLINLANNKPLIKFDEGSPPSDKIPLRMIAALFAVSYITELTRKRNRRD